MTDCPGSCNAWWRNLTPEQQDASEPRPRQGEPVWCRQCKTRIRRSLPDLDYLAAMLAAAADGHRERPEDTTRRRAGNTPSPSAIGDTIGLFTGAAFDWEDNYRQILRMPGAYHTGPVNEIRSKVIAWLTENLDGVLASPMAGHFGQEVLDWHRRLTAMAKAGTGRRRMPVPCPWCGYKLLVKVAGDDYVACTNPGNPPREPPCRCRLTIAEYEAERDAALHGVEQAG